jgi:hypothetical protein
MFEAAAEQTEPDQVAEWVLHMTDSIQGGCVNADTDPLKLDTMHRLIEMLPPTGDRERMSQVLILACMSRCEPICTRGPTSVAVSRRAERHKVRPSVGMVFLDCVPRDLTLVDHV